MKKELNGLITELLIVGIIMGNSETQEEHDKYHCRASEIFDRITEILDQLEVKDVAKD